MVGPLRLFMLAAANYRIELHLRPMLHQAHFDEKGGDTPFAARRTNASDADFSTET